MSYWNPPQRISKRRRFQAVNFVKKRKELRALKPPTFFECFRKSTGKVLPLVGGSDPEHPQPDVVQLVPTSCEVNFDADEFSRLAAAGSDVSYLPPLLTQNYILRPQESSTDWKRMPTGSEMISLANRGGEYTNHTNLDADVTGLNDLPTHVGNGCIGIQLSRDVVGDPVSPCSYLSHQIAVHELNKDDFPTALSTDISTVPAEMSIQSNAGSSTLLGTQITSQSRGAPSTGDLGESVHATSNNI
jgi:hypothetical protein